MECTCLRLNASCLLPTDRQVESLLVARNAAALKAPAFADVSDAIILQLFELALSCTAMPTGRRPNTLKLVAELEALWSQLAGKAADLSEKVDRVLRQTEQYSTKTLRGRETAAL